MSAAGQVLHEDGLWHHAWVERYEPATRLYTVVLQHGERLETRIPATDICKPLPPPPLAALPAGPPAASGRGGPGQHRRGGGRAGGRGSGRSGARGGAGAQMRLNYAQACLMPEALGLVSAAMGRSVQGREGGLGFRVRE